VTPPLNRAGTLLIWRGVLPEERREGTTNTLALLVPFCGIQIPRSNERHYRE